MATINGSDNPEALNGTYFSDFIYAYGGNDTVRGGFGSDWIYGGDGNDRLFGGYQSDRLNGEAGADFLQGDDGDDSFNGGAGADTMLGGNGRDTFQQYDVSEAAGDSIAGGAGIDTLVLNLAALSGSFTFAIQDPTVTTTLRFGGLPTFTFREVEEFNVIGTDYADRLTGWFNDDTLTGGMGNDTIAGGMGRDQLTGDDGNDLIQGGGDDDALYGYSGNDRLAGDAGHDRLDGGSDNDSLYGAAGNDAMDGGSGSDRLEGGDGNDELRSDSWGSDTGRERDVVLGQGGNDGLWIGMNDLADAGAGLDTIHVDFTEETAAINWAFSPAAKQFANGASVVGAEVLDYEGGSGRDVISGWNYADTLYGYDGNDQLSGGGGADVLSGGRGDDVLFGGAGNDHLDHDSGNDSLYGGVGDDSFAIDFDGNAVRPYRALVDGGDGYDTVTFESFDLGAVLDLSNQALNDGLAYGKILRNIEVVEGTYADDYLAGSGGRDIFFGGSGSDILAGRAGNDFLSGGWSSDVLAGGGGADVFDFADFTVYDWEGDVITDFTRGQDKLRFDAADFGAGLRLVNALHPVASTAAPSLIFETDTKRLWYDADGNGADESPLLIATLYGVGQLASSDLLFV